MDTIMLRSHSGLRWIVLILLIVTIFNAFKKWKANEAYGALDNKLSLFTVLFTHIQFLLGVYLFFTSSKVVLKGLEMSNAIMRFFTVEHTLGMLIAIVLITVGRAQSKRIAEDALKHKKVFIMFFIALIIILISIPWPFRNLGAGWF